MFNSCRITTFSGEGGGVGEKFKLKAKLGPAKARAELGKMNLNETVNNLYFVFFT